MVFLLLNYRMLPLAFSPFDGMFYRRVQVPSFQPLGGYLYEKYIDRTYTSAETFDKQALIGSDQLTRQRRVHICNAGSMHGMAIRNMQGDMMNYPGRTRNHNCGCS